MHILLNGFPFDSRILAQIEQQYKIFCCCCWAHTMCHWFLCWKRHEAIPLSFRINVTHPITNLAKRTTCSSSSSKCSNVLRNTGQWLETVLCVGVKKLTGECYFGENQLLSHRQSFGHPRWTYPRKTYMNSPSLVAAHSTAEEQY